MTLNYSIAIKDVNGITIDGVTKKVNSGNPIDLNVTSFDITLKPLISFPESTNIPLTTGTRFKDRMSSVAFTGMESPVVHIRSIIDMDHSALNTATHTTNSVAYTYLTFPLFFDLVTVPNIYYLKDFLGSSATYKPPISALMDTIDFYDQTDWGSNSKVLTSDGLPVVFVSGAVKRIENSEQGHFIHVDFELRGVDPD